MENKFLDGDFGVIVECNNDKEILEYLVDKGFNNWNGYIDGAYNGSYYYIFKDDNIIWCDYNNPTSSTFTLKQLKEIFDSAHTKFVLPKKWCIKINQEVKNWIKSEFHTDYYNGENESVYFHFPNYYNYKGFEAGNHISTEIIEDYTEITPEQFKKYILKQENMEKKIIGYKLIKPEYKEAALKLSNTVGNWENVLAVYDININQTNYINKLQQAGVLDLWFEPVYEEEFKEGDYIVITDFGRATSGLDFSLNTTYKLSRHYTEENGFHVEKDNAGRYNGWGNGFELGIKIRKATPEEIEAAQKTIVRMRSSNKGEFPIEIVDGKAYYRPEDKHLPKEWVRQIINNFGSFATKGPYDIKTEHLTVGCMEGTLKKDWEKVYKLLK